MKIAIAPASTPAEIRACRELVAQVYGEAYGVRFSETEFNLDERVEGWPDRFLMALSGKKLAACLGIYDGPTYVERFGGVTAADLDPLLKAAGVRPEAAGRRWVELARMTTNREFRSRHVGLLLTGAAHSMEFLDARKAGLPLVLTCLRLSLSEKFWGHISVGCRTIKPFPEYRIHDRYRIPGDPMVSRLTIPEVDVPARWLNLKLPTAVDAALLEGDRWRLELPGQTPAFALP